MGNVRFTAKEAKEIATDNVINNLDNKQKFAYNEIVNKIKEISESGQRYWCVDKENEYYKYLNIKIINILIDDGFTIQDNYADEEWDYEYFGKIIKW